MRRSVLAPLALVLWGLGSACGGVSSARAPGQAGAAGDGGAAATPAAPVEPPPPPPGERRVLVLSGGEERLIDPADAEKQGYTIVSLREDWTPYIFENLSGADGRPLPNRYRTIFLGLASDTTDSDGQPLGSPAAARRRRTAPKPATPVTSGETPHNYLEVYGIPPTLSVLRARFLEDTPDAQGRDRCADVDRAKLASTTSVPLIEPKGERRYRARIAALRRKLEAKRRALRLGTLEDLATAQPKMAADVQAVRREELSHLVFPEAEKRVLCEGLLSPKAKHQPGVFDDPLRDAVIRFQRKNKIYEAPSLRKETLAAMARPLLENDQAALERILTERAVEAADVLEDGTVDKPGPRGAAGETRPTIPPTYKNAKGETVPMRNLVQEIKQATLEQLGLTSPEASLAFFKRHPAEDFQWLRVGIKLPPRPEYYAPDMELHVEIDPGDIFYDPPFDPQGKPVNQSRQHYPKLTLFVHYLGQIIPLVRWRTTIGGWRSDLASNGYEYFRYKGSDTGARAWRHIVAGPVWIAPNSTPLRTLVKSKRVRDTSQTVVNYDEVGPGFLSAYGLVAAYNVVPGKEGKPDWDNGIRVHGSSEFRSMFDPEGYSHGCHRLVNHLAERLFSFILRHRHRSVEGDIPLGFSRQFLWKEDVFTMRLPTRGYRFTLDPPVPVLVTEGNIRGTLKKPVTAYVPKPGVVYPPGPMPVPPNSPEARAGGGGE